MSTADIIQWNCEGILPKKGELEKLVTEKDPVCVCLQETKLPYNATCRLPGYKSFLKNLEVLDGGNAHGGVAVLVRRGVSAFAVDLNTRLQAVAVSVKLRKRITVCSLYLPPGEVIQRRQLEGLITQLPEPFLLLGDFNARSKLWYDSDYCPRGKMVERIIEEGDFFFLDKDQSTHFSRRHRSYSHVDLSLCSIDLVDSYKWEVDEFFHSSDHAPIYLSDNEPLPRGGCQRWILGKADWPKYRDGTEISVEVDELPSTETAVSFLNDIILDAAGRSIPLSRGNGKRKSPPWWNRACLLAIRRRKGAWRKYSRDTTDGNYLSFLRLRAEAQRVIRCSKRKAWSELIGSINSKSSSKDVWRKINLLQSKHRSELVSTLKVEESKVVLVEDVQDEDQEEIIHRGGSYGCIMEVEEVRPSGGAKSLSIRFESEVGAREACDQLDGSLIGNRPVCAKVVGQRKDTCIHDEPVDLANCLGRRFEFVSSAFNCDEKFRRDRKDREHFIDFSSEDHLGYNSRITIKELTTALDAVGDTAPGPDGIHYAMLKNLSETGKTFLLDLLNRIFEDGELPKNWKLAYVIPILKEGKDPLSPDSYRPIALTSCICKLLGRITNKRLMWFLESHNLIHKSQSGFRRGRSPLDNLVALETEVHDAFVQKQYLLAVFFDLEKAYDTCWRHLILKELHGFGMRGRLPLLIQDFLSDRKFQVRVGSHLSSVFTQEMGVPQGCVLSTTLFLIAINTVVREVRGQVNVSIFVDDMRFSIAAARLSCAVRRKQRCLDKVDAWTQKTGFRFSSKKTEVMVFHRQRGLAEDPQPELYLNGKKLKVVTEKRFLGALLDHKLTWVPHIKWVKARGLRALSILKVIVKNNTLTDGKILLNIYRAVVRSKLDYACQVYGTAAPSALKMLDTVHHQALRLCTGAFRTSPVDSLYVESGEPALSDRRLSLQLQYYARSKKVPADKTMVHLDDTMVDQYYRRVRNKPKSLGFRVRRDANDLGLVFPSISLLTESRLGPWEVPAIVVCLELAACVKATTCQEEFRQKFREHRHAVDLEVYTDGSKGETGVGAGFGMIANRPGNGFSGRRLHAMASVFTAELFAIKLALISLRAYENRSCVIYSDSRSALQAIQKLGSSIPLVGDICELVDRLVHQRISVSFCWIPSHIGIVGNELADAAAKRAASQGAVFTLEVPESDVKAWIKRKMRVRWEERWHNIQDNRKLRQIQPTLARKVASLNRRDSVKLTRLRIGHSRLTHSYLLTGQDRPECIECTWDEEDPVWLTVEHILMECGNHALDRGRFFDPRDIPMSELLSDDRYVRRVLEFLHRIELYNQI